MDNLRYKIQDRKEQMENLMTDMRWCLEKIHSQHDITLFLVVLTEADNHVSLKVTIYWAKKKNKSLQNVREENSLNSLTSFYKTIFSTAKEVSIFYRPRCMWRRGIIILVIYLLFYTY